MIQSRFNCAVLADRNSRLTEGMRGLLETMFETVVVVANVTSLLESAHRLQPEMAAVDVSLGQDANLTWVGELRRRCPEIKVIALSVHDEPSVHRVATNAGFDRFVLKRSIATELLPTVEDLLSPSPGQQGQAAPTEDEPEE
jgi:DNA-binding NarL/FixJ family response regulator